MPNYFDNHKGRAILAQAMADALPVIVAENNRRHKEAQEYLNLVFKDYGGWPVKDLPEWPSKQ